MVKLRAYFAYTNDTPYLALMGEIWDDFREFFNENWPRYIESALCCAWDIEQCYKQVIAIINSLIVQYPEMFTALYITIYQYHLMHCALISRKLTFTSPHRRYVPCCILYNLQWFFFNLEWCYLMITNRFELDSHRMAALHTILKYC